MRSHHLTLALAIAACAIGRVAQAASFDCAKAAFVRERLICGAPHLSQMDQELGSLYTTRLALLSRTGAATLQSAQRAWLAYTGEICGLLPNASSAAYHDETPTSCLSKAYESRLSDIRAIGRFGPYVFTRVDTYDVQPGFNEMDSEEGPAFDVHHVGYPQIDAAANPVLVAWNRKAATAGVENGDIELQGKRYDETDGDFEIGLVTKHLISLLWTTRWQTHGAAHGGYGSFVWNSVLSSPLHDVTPAELFGAGVGWKKRLEEMALTAIKGHGWKGDENEDTYVRMIIDDPSRWFLRPKGLEVTFGAYDGGCYMCTPNDGLVPWDKLTPLLQTTLLPYRGHR